MKYLRWALGALLGLYALRSLYYIAITLGHQMGGMAVPDNAARFTPLIDAMPLWQTGLWLVAVIAYVIAAYRLLRGGKALVPLVVGVVCDAAGWLLIKGTAAYQSVFNAQEQQVDYIIMGVLVAAVVVVWWTERETTAAAAA